MRGRRGVAEKDGAAGRRPARRRRRRRRASALVLCSNFFRDAQAVRVVEREVFEQQARRLERERHVEVRA